MAAPPAHFLYGGTSLMLESYTITGRLYGLDTVRAVFNSGSATGIIPGTMLPSPLPLLKAREVETERMGSLYRHRVDAIGFVNSKSADSLPGFPRYETNGEDWDTFTDKRLAASRTLVHPGDIGGSGLLYCVKTEAIEIEPGVGWYEHTSSYVGIAETKCVTTTISVNGATYSADSISQTPDGAWSPPQKGTIDLPEVVVSKRYLTSLPPPTNAIPGSGSLPGLPPVKSIYLFGTDIVRHWPAGWSYDGIDSKQVMDKPLYDTTIKLRYKHQYTW